MTDRVAVCPRCDEPTIRRRDLESAYSSLDGRSSKRYYCDTCQDPFHTPAYRAPKCPAGTLAARLQDADAEDVLPTEGSA